MKIILKKDQVAFLRKFGEKRVTNKMLSKNLAISLPTLRKIMKSEPPIIVNDRIFNIIDDWMNTK